MNQGTLRRDEIARPVLSSNSWIWGHPSLINLTSSNSGALAIIGKAGCGKSVLAKTIQEGILHHWNQISQFSDSRELLVCDWFYCRRRGDVFTAYSSLLRNVLYQLLLKRPSLYHHYKLLYRRKLSTGSQNWAIEELQEIMENINTSSLSILMIFDAIDEAEDDRMVSFVEGLVSSPGSSTKAILLSRPTDAFESPFWEAHRLTLQEENKQDIRLVVQHGLSKLWSIMNGRNKDSEGELPATGKHVTRGPIKSRTHAALRQRPYPSPRPAAAPFSTRHSGNSLNFDVLEKYIRERAAGVILWVVLIFDSVYKFVRRQPLVTLHDIISCIEELPRDIDCFYGQMVKDLAETMSHEALHTARQALMWINAASQFKAFTMEELWDALAASSRDLNRPASERTQQSLIDGRIEIQSWKDFDRTLRRLCGSLIEILPPETATSRGNSGNYIYVDSKASSGKCVIQLMHQTVKDFLTSSSSAGFFSFTEAAAQHEVLRGCQNFIKYVLPDPIDSIIPLQRDRPEDWVFFSNNMARYLEEFRLFPLCLQVFDAFPESMEALQTQLYMKWFGLLPRWLWDVRGTSHVQEWVYDPEESTLTTAALGVMFQFISRRGLRNAARNLMSILDMGSDAEFWLSYRGVILIALKFTVVELDRSFHSNRLRARLQQALNPRSFIGHVSPEEDYDTFPRPGTPVAYYMDLNQYYDRDNGEKLLNDRERVEKVPNADVVETIELILDYKAGKPLWLDPSPRCLGNLLTIGRDNFWWVQPE